MGRIFVAGSLNMDTSINIERMPDRGETLAGHGLKYGPGGKGANQAVAASRLGGRVSMCGCVGDDASGKALFHNLSANHVDTEHVASLADIPTGTAIVLLEKGDNRIIIEAGANAQVGKAMIEEFLSGAGHGDLLLVQLEIPLDAVEHAMRKAKGRGMRVVLNPAPAKPLDDGFLGLVDTIILNETETAILTGIHPEDLNSAATAGSFLMAKGIDSVILTLGEKGGVLMDGGVHPYDAKKTTAVDTTAAGDTFIGAYCASICAGESSEAAIEYASAAAALAVSRRGAQDSIPYQNEVKREYGFEI